MYLFFRMLIALTLASVLTVGSFLQAPASAHAAALAPTPEQGMAEQPWGESADGIDARSSEASGSDAADAVTAEDAAIRTGTLIQWPLLSVSASPGETTGLVRLIPSSYVTASGRMEVFAPAGTRIVQVRELMTGAFQIRDDGRSAVSNTEFGGWGSLTPDIELRVEPESLPGSVLDDGLIRVTNTNLSGSTITGEGRIQVTVAGLHLAASPTDVSTAEYQSARFQAEARGYPEATAQWQSSADGGTTWTDVDGATDAELVVEDVRLSMDGSRYRAVFSNSTGSVTSEAATLTVNPARPVVTERPAPAGVPAGSAAEFSAAYGGTDAETTAQWQFSTDGGATFNYVPAGVGPNGAQSIPLIIDPVTPEMDGWLYRVRFTNAAGSAWSDAARLTVTAVWPDVVGQAVAGGSVEVRIYSADEPRTGVLEVTAPEGTRITSARSNGTNIAFLISEDGRSVVSSRLVNPWGGAGPSAWVTLQVDPDAPAGAVLGGGQARAMSSAGVPNMVASIAVEVIAVPEVTQHPQDVSVVEGQGAVLSAAATGHPAPTVQWQTSTDAGASWADVDGATRVELQLSSTALDMDGTHYRAVFTNSAGTAATESARLSVREVRYLNLSVRPIVRLVDAL